MHNFLNANSVFRDRWSGYAVLFCSEEDFTIVPREKSPMACGKIIGFEHLRSVITLLNS
jgi:hypothetical protein